MLPTKVMGRLPWFTPLARCNAEANNPFPTEKVSLAALSRNRPTCCAAATWLKITENNALKKP
jgi:hypothetical protein